jgi:hypothetical protein
MPEADALRIHLVAANTAFRGYEYTSCFIAAVRDARQDAGRHPDTGTVIDAARTGHWLGAVGYLILLDQIGKCFSPKGQAATPTNSPSIVRCLANWAPHVPPDEAGAIYALRNALAHDYGLFNPNANELKHQHLFALSNSTGPMVRLPMRPWDGDYLNAADECRTTVSLREVGSLVEAIITALREAVPSGIDILLRGGSDELLRRYGLLVQPLTLTGP